MATIHPVLSSPASLIDCIASYKLSMVHKLCRVEHNTPLCRDMHVQGPCLFVLSMRWLSEICFVNCAMRSQGLEKRQG